VKVINSSAKITGQDLDRFVRALAKAKHPNIIQLVGYCNERKMEHEMRGGKLVFTHKVRMALCFEYVHNGSLEAYLNGAMLLDIT
jgi:hypothetical protein